MIFLKNFVGMVTEGFIGKGSRFGNLRYSRLGGLRYSWAFALVAFVVCALPVFGKKPNNIQDFEDMVPAGLGSASVDVTRWFVSEPYVNLWLYSQPMTYPSSFGRTYAAGLAFRQRQTFANVYGFGADWGFNWRSFVYYALDGTGTNLSYAYYYLPLGGAFYFSGNGVARDFRTYYSVSVQRNGTNGITGFTVQTPSGGSQVLDYVVPAPWGAIFAHLTKDIDPQNRTNLFQYETVQSGSYGRLVRMIDPDNRTNTVRYTGPTTLYISEIENPYGRKADFGYDGSGNLTSITNVVGMVDKFSYDSSGTVTNLLTPYGTNSFQFTSQSFDGYSFGGTNQVNRSVLVTEPTGDHELFMYRDDCSKLNPSSSVNLLPSSYASSQVPVTSPLANLFDNSYLDTRNSFHWGKMQYLGLSEDFTSSVNPLTTGSFDNLSTNDYNLAAVSHWLRGAGDVATIYPVVSFARNPSPDGTSEGQKVWYDYTAKNTSYPWCVGTNSTPMLEAVVLPDGNTRFKYTAQNRFGWPTTITTTYTSNNVVAQRSLTFTYATNDIDQVTMRGPSNELLSSNAWNSVHQVLTNYNAVNDLTTFTYDSGARVTSVKSPTGLTTTNLYYTSGTHIGWLQQTIDVEITRTNGFGYMNGQISAQTNALGLVTTYVRDALDRVLEGHSPSINVTNTYSNLELAITANSGVTNRYFYDALGRMTNSIGPRGYTNTLSYCGCGFLLTNKNGLGNYSSFGHDWLSRRTSAVLPDLATTTTWSYDLLGQTTNVTIVGLTSITNYVNNQGLLATSTNALGQVEAHLYDVYDRDTNSTDVNGITITNTYDLLGRVLTRTYPDGGVEKYAYSAAGMTLYTNQLGFVTKYGYDAAGRKIAVTNANSEITRYVYDAEGNITQLTDGKNQSTYFTFDAYGRLVRETNAASVLVLTNGYDALGRLNTRWTPAKGLTTFYFDLSGNVTNIDHPNSPDVTFAYDAVNQMTSMVDAAGTTTFTYDADGNLAWEDGPWSADTVSYAYTKGLRTGMYIQQPYGSTLNFYYSYDSISRLSSITALSGLYFTYTYQTTDASNAKGSLIKKITLPNGSYVTNAFNSMGQLLSTYLKDSGHNVLNSHSYTYNVGAQRTRQTRTAGDYVDYTYDSIGQLQSATGKESGGSPTRLHEKLGYAYDAAGNLQYRTNNALVQTFSVDSLNQLSSISRSGTITVAGNSSAAASTVTVNNSSATLYGDNAFAKDSLTLTNGANSFTAIGTDSSSRSSTNTMSGNYPTSVSLTYDSNGNLTSDGNLGYVYDDENQLIRVTATNSWSAGYTYDGRMRRRVRAESNWVNSAWVKTTEVRYVYDGNLIVQERNSDNLPLTTYTRGLDLSGTLCCDSPAPCCGSKPACCGGSGADTEGAGGIGGLLARTDHTVFGGRTDYYHQDGNGNVTYLADQNQRLSAKYTYDPYGRVDARAGVVSDVNRMQWSGKESDSASGLSYYGRRFYDPVLQRWLNQDPTGINHESVNSFVIAGNSASLRYEINVTPKEPSRNPAPGSRDGSGAMAVVTADPPLGASSGRVHAYALGGPCANIQDIWTQALARAVKKMAPGGWGKAIGCTWARRICNDACEEQYGSGAWPDEDDPVCLKKCHDNCEKNFQRCAGLMPLPKPKGPKKGEPENPFPS